MSRDAAAALMCRLGWRTVLVQSKERANVPIDLHTTDTTKQQAQSLFLNFGAKRYCAAE